MKTRVCLLVISAIALGACSKQESVPAPKQSTTAAVPAKAVSPVVAAPKSISPERISEIEATGLTGLWSTEASVCAKDVNKGLRTTLVWNVTASGAKRVIVYVIGKDGQEMHFGQGPSIDEKITGPWLKPGIIFKIRDYDTSKELGSVVIGEKAC